MITMLNRLLRRAPEPLAYEDAREQASSSDASARAALARREDVRPEILYYLAKDGSVDVRRAVAGNDATPIQAGVILARDTDIKVREMLAEKIGRLFPDLSIDQRDAVRVALSETLEILARDQVQRVRTILAEALKDVTNAPPHIVSWLARDREIEVASPVLECSPLLGDDDLVAVIANAPIRGALTAIARRTTVSSRVADAIVDAEDHEAVTALLDNSSAQIREETLDRLIEKSRSVEDWQPPLVRRPKLPAAAAAKLANFVADSLLSLLRSRGDLDNSTLDAVEKAVSKRLIDAPGSVTEQRPPKREVNNSAGVGRARTLQAEGKLNEDSLSTALAEGDQACILEGLAILAGVPRTTVARIRAARSAKGITALAWKAGLPMRFAIRLQSRFAGVAPDEIINAHDGIDYPLTPDEMEWMLGFFKS
jgi:uncharacterized protein (DUF2336 family)